MSHAISQLKCNGCWSECPRKQPAVATCCGHLYCLSCAQTIIEGEARCVICEQELTKFNVKAVNLLSDASSFSLTLAGQTPEVAMSAALAGVQFFSAQQELYAQARAQQAASKAQQVHEKYRNKLRQVSEGYATVKRKYAELLQSNQELQQDKRELLEKYNLKATQDQKLREHLATLQSENEHLRRQCSLPPRQQQQPGGMGMGMHALGPAPTPRTFSPGPGGVGGQQGVPAGLHGPRPGAGGGSPGHPVRLPLPRPSSPHLPAVSSRPISPMQSPSSTMGATPRGFATPNLGGNPPLRDFAGGTTGGGTAGGMGGRGTPLYRQQLPADPYGGLASPVGPRGNFGQKRPKPDYLNVHL